MADLIDITTDWLIKCAKEGFREPLAKAIRRGHITGNARLEKFVADVVAGDVRLKRPRHLPSVNRYHREENVLWLVDQHMARLGKKRDAAERTRAIRKACTLPMCETTPASVESYSKHRRRR